MQWYLQFVLCLLMCQHVCQASSDCPIPTEDKEISICSYCSDSHAGVRWAVHPSALNKYPDGPYRLIISFRCIHTQNMIDITEDACFNGDFIRRLIYLTEPSVWRWHILGQRLPEGMQCQFITTVRDGHTRSMPRLQMSTSCIIGDSKSSPVMPATCLSPELIPQGCPCRCSDGFTIDERGDVTDSLICRNIDECSEGSHNCINASDCVDTEGGHYCRIVFSIEFSSSAYTVSEDDSFIDLTITKTLVDDAVSSNQPSITVLFYTSDGTALDQEDYSSLNLSVTFTPDESEKSVRVSIIDDTIREDSETFYGNLMIVSHLESLAKIITAEATIEISYNDCNCNCTDGNCSCHSGYFGNGMICQDDNECANGLHDCDINASCTNTDGSFECSCNNGFLGDGKTCIDDKNLIPCPCNSSESCFSFNNNGIEMCGCLPGYIRQIDNQSNETCTDINECGSHVCGNGTCINMPGSFTCTCPPGYTFNLDERQCTDVDECRTGVNNCSKIANCFNTEGSYNCTCRDGFIGNGITCLKSDINSDCGTLSCSQLCTNTTGSLTCACHPGYYLNTLNLRECEDLDECEFHLYSCDINADCKNTIGSYECKCKSGYRGNGIICNDINECDTGLVKISSYPDISNCHNLKRGNNHWQSSHVDECTTEKRICNNTIGSYEYDCKEGYQENEISKICEDIDECLDSTFCSKSNEKCMNTPEGSYTCQCMDGYEYSNNSECVDIDECATNQHTCSDRMDNCKNIIGSYECRCKEGYIFRKSSGFEEDCQDIDECTTNQYNCSDRMDCKNTIGGYECRCKDGYNYSMGFEEECQDVDECTMACFESENWICNNTIGSYECDCKEGYIIYQWNETSKLCEDINECNSGYHLCHPNATCTNTPGTYTCECDAGYVGNGSICQEIQPPIANSQQEIIIISSTVGAMVFLLLIAIVVIMVYICYYIRKFSGVSKEKNDFSPIDPNNYVDRESLSRTISVQSSYKLHLPPYLLIHSANIKLTEPIGQGEFGIVYKGYIIVKEQGSIVTDIVAVKTLKGLYDRSTVKDMLKECAKMYKFDHPNVLTLRGVCLDGGTAPYIIMPFMANGSLLAYLKKNRETLVVSLSNKDEDNVMVTRKRLIDMCIQVAKGMEYLASKKMVHRDLAARNCMIDMNFVIKVADFGLAESVEIKEYFRQDKSSHIKLPMKWLAPESMGDYMFSEKSDVWAYGVTCWEIFSGGKVPYGGVHVTDLSRLLADGNRLEKPNNDACSDQLYKLILQCWEFETVNRPRFADIVSELSESLRAMAGYLQLLDIGAFSGQTTVMVAEINECRETMDLVEEQLL